MATAAQAAAAMQQQELAMLQAEGRQVLTIGQVAEILLYIYAAGAVLNGTVLFASLMDYKRLLKTSMDRLTAGLVSVCFLWSVGRGVVHSLQGLNQLSLQNQGAAAFSNVCIMIIFCLNVHLAMERYFQIKDHPYALQLYSALYIFFVTCVLVVVWMFATSTTIDGIKPDASTQRLAWVLVASSSYGVTVLLMGWFYTRTYRYSSRQFDENPALATFFMSENDGTSDDPEVLKLVRIRVERQILTKCLLLSLTLVICYAPFFTYQVMSYGAGVNPFPDFDPNGVFYDVGVILLSSDVVFTPLLVFIFKKEVRENLMFWK